MKEMSVSVQVVRHPDFLLCWSHSTKEAPKCVLALQNKPHIYVQTHLLDTIRC